MFLETAYGPTLKARERLTAEGRWDACRTEMLALAERRNEATDGKLLLPAEYAVAVGPEGALTAVIPARRSAPARAAAASMPSSRASAAARAESSSALAASPGPARRRSASASPARERATYGRARIRIDALERQLE